MNTVLIANIISFAGAILMVLIGFIKDKNKVLEAQNAQFGLLAVSNLMLGGVSGGISNVLSIIRNLICLKTGVLSRPVKALFIVVQAALTLAVNHSGLIGWLPVIAATALTMALDTKNPVTLKAVIILGQICWIFYDFAFLNYVAFAFDVMTVISNIAGIISIMHTKTALDVK